jgi:tRNA-2-methylthio-N6-dimethylallyladenosine synthase
MPAKNKKVFIKTFGCAQNTADSERIKAYFWDQGYENTDEWKNADTVVINSCIVRESAENRVYGLIDKIRKNNLPKSLFNKRDFKQKIIVTGCLAGIRGKIDNVDEVWPIAKFENWAPLRDIKGAALIPISSGCNNFCSYCIVPMARGKEDSRKMETILQEIDKAIAEGFKEVVLIGQNVNSYNPSKSPFDKGDLKTTVHMGKKRFQSLFPKLLDEVAKKPLKKISFISSNPWDFSDELIETIAKNANIDRLIHLPFQAGDDEILKKMNRSYTQKEYLELVEKIKKNIPGVKISTDIIIGFPGEDEKAFQETVKVCQKVGFDIAYINKYSPRKGTLSAKLYPNDIPQAEKRRRWKVLDDLVNKKTT